ncbi:hypothetical protein E4U43_003354, partial [Claviceps pusilla]
PSASKTHGEYKPLSTKRGDWLTNIDTPATLEADQRLESLLNWDHIRHGLPSTAPFVPVALAKTESFDAASPGPEKASTSTLPLVLPSSVREAQKFTSGPLWSKYDDLVCHVRELQSHNMNHIDPPAALHTNEIQHQGDSSDETRLPSADQFHELQSQNMRNSSSAASLFNQGPGQIKPSFINSPILPHAYRHASKPLLISPSRQRSLNDLTLPTSMHPPSAIIRPKSIPSSSTSRFIPPGLIPLNSIADFQNGLHLQKVANVPNFFNSELHMQMNHGHDINHKKHNNNNNQNHNHPNIINNNNNNFNNNIIRSPNLPTTESRFIPMLSITRPDRTGRDFTPVLQQSTHHAASSLKFSPRYHGMHTENNASMEHLPPEQNCALWLTNLPPDIRERELLASVRNVGRIYATFINYPDGHAHATSAAKLVFFTPEAAQKLLVYCTLVKPMVIRGHRVKIALNRIKYAKNSMENGESRVLIITGHREFVNEASLTAFFQARFQFQIDEAVTLITHKERAVVEYKFGSYRCQAQMGMKALLLDKPAGLEMVEYGADPCEVGSEVTSFTVAGERIQGRGLLLKE